MGQLADVLEKEELKTIKQEIAEFVSFMLNDYVEKVRNSIESDCLDLGSRDFYAEKSFYDSVWGTIEIGIGEVMILDSPLLQRLKKIKQLGLADMLYSSANHTRFSHTLGVLQTADVMASKISKQMEKKLQATAPDMIPIIRLSAIFHDIGHMFCSHASERFFQSNTKYKDYKKVYEIRKLFKLHLGIKPSLSEIFSVLIINDSSVKELLMLINDSLEGVYITKRTVDDITEKIGCFILGYPYSEKYIPYAQIISGQIDADKLDYLKRDSHSTGVPVAVDMSRVFQKIRVVESNRTNFKLINSADIPHPDKVYKLGIAAAATNTLDQLIVSRMMMFENVYYHQKTLTAEETLRHAMQMIDESTSGIFDSFSSILLITDDLIINNDFARAIQLIDTEYTVDNEELFKRGCQVWYFSFVFHKENMEKYTKENWKLQMPELTRKVMRSHYAGQSDIVWEYMSDDIVWIGPLDSQYVQGKEQVKELLKPEQDVRVLVTEDDYFCVCEDENSCTIVGKLMASILPKEELLLMVKQRYTFQWKWINGRPQITHIHGSNVWNHVDEEETFSYRVAKEAYGYLQDILKQKRQQSQKIMFRDISGKTVFLRCSRIIYIEACIKHCVIHHLDGNLEVTGSISELQDLLPEQFCRIHRSLIINVYHVMYIKRYEVTVYGEISLPIPEKKYKSIKEIVIRRQKNLLLQ